MVEDVLMQNPYWLNIAPPLPVIEEEAIILLRVTDETVTAPTTGTEGAPVRKDITVP
jgi:hypothetical protein